MCPLAGDGCRLVAYSRGMSNSNPAYISFLVRLWRESPASRASQADGGAWLAQVEQIPSGEKVYFASLNGLFAFIRAQLPAAPADERKPTV